MPAGDHRFAVKVHACHTTPCGKECNVIRNSGQEDPVLTHKHPAKGEMTGQSGFAHPHFHGLNRDSERTGNRFFLSFRCYAALPLQAENFPRLAAGRVQLS